MSDLDRLFKQPLLPEETLKDALHLTREKMRDFHDILYSLALQNGGELRLIPPVQRQKMIRIYRDERTGEIVISATE